MIDFDTLYTRYHPSIYAFLLQRTRSHELAEDLTQETFLKAWVAWERATDTNLKNWLLLIARRTSIDAGLKRARQDAASLDALCAGGMDVEDGQADIAERCAMGDVRRRALQRLPAHYRAELLKCASGWNKGAQNNELSRARQLFRKAMKEVSA